MTLKSIKWEGFRELFSSDKRQIESLKTTTANAVMTKGNMCRFAFKLVLKLLYAIVSVVLKCWQFRYVADRIFY